MVKNKVRVFDKQLANLVFGYSHSPMWANTRASSKHKLRSRQRSITTPRKQRTRCPIMIPRKKRKLQETQQMRSARAALRNRHTETASTEEAGPTVDVPVGDGGAKQFRW